ncbi:MAG: regulatory protein ArsR [Halanaerobium sp. 4-GBenrich]|jgi:ArsR family transcriptional regulator|uniref:Regulatory ArsR family protein n=1 Tax=Halanaerobium congolense TaxID=54121 RepID=A0A1M7P6W4_9FIRM|nr:metalloregulator ArsR/SmtB family transcription factor [Halanaerobium congolense]ODS50320.1 MAG: regulatory protein ArsR [Halanaerobium sp. 4-GBenrich]PUU93124.1 MAG: regulatory protein ArsR [Halanaerobium sp.]PTX15659.1 regulatory ArsR family protein [Halanaerobium congolense]PXV68713.1 regulatory ArsR family protein [Halanaerobium congolense]TDP07988.1 regulatory ArsR family protein [Halanaerobium congolense]
MKKLLNFLKCIADENRLKILKLLLDSQFCVCQLQELLDKSQSSVSQHLSYFKQLNLLNEDKSGKLIYYSIDRSVYDSFLANLISLKASSLSELELEDLENKINNLDTAAEIRTENKERGCC